MATFKLSVFTDEITHDLGRALEIASREFGLGYVELRGMWNKNIMLLDSKEIAEARSLLQRFRLRVSSIAGQFRALKEDGYRGAVVLETHWRGAGTAEESTRQSMAGMKELLRRAGAI